MSQIDRFVITAKPAVHVGPGAIGELPGVVRAVGADRAVVVTDAALASAPVIDTVLTMLADAGLPARVLVGVHSQPTLDDLAACADAVAQAAAETATTAAASASAAAVTAMLRPSAPLVAPSLPAAPLVATPQPAPPALAGPRIALVAVGGGAPIDAAKGIAIAAVNPRLGQHLDRRDLDGRRDLEVPALPIVAVPTAAGAGAEASAFGLVTDPADGRAFRVGHASTMPAAAILDPDLTDGLPAAVTAGCGLDALTRALESYLSLRSNPWSDGIALQVVRMVAASLPRAVMDGTDLAARSQLLLAGHMAGVAAASAGLGLCHAIARSLGAHRDVEPGDIEPGDIEPGDIAPGASLAVLLPEVLRFNLPARVERMADVAFALGVGDTHADAWLNAEAAIGAVTALRDDVGLNRLIGDFGITEADFAPIAAGALADEALASTPRPPAEDDIRAILLAVAGQPR